MLRRTAPLGFYRGHTSQTQQKFIDKPGLWGPLGGPPKDTLARRMYFYRILLFNKIGRITRPFRTNQARWVWRKIQLRVWKTSVFTIAFIIMILIGNLWCIFVYHAYAVGPTTPVLERKVREHRVSKQILGMVREKEKDISQEIALEEARRAVKAQ
eukprot:Tbor_TRINITY_DN6223_c0_g2::TRINITY_DN6223_c0_g2_i1::g.1851::m.1851